MLHGVLSERHRARPERRNDTGPILRAGRVGERDRLWGWVLVFAVAGRSTPAQALVQAELGLDLIERVHIVRVRLVLPQCLLDLLVELLERMPRRGVDGVVPKLFEERVGELPIVCRALADGGRLRTVCDGLGGCEFVLLGTPEGRDVLLRCELVLDEGIEEFVVEGLVPGLAGEHCAEVGAALAHHRLEADHGGALGGHCHVLGRGREPDDVRAVVGKHRLVPRNAQLQLRVGEPDPHQNV